MEISHKVKDLRTLWQRQLASRYGDREAAWIVRALLEDTMGWNSTDIILKGDYEFNVHTVTRLSDMVERISGGEPVQYVTGRAPFHGLMFNVSPAVLIPRPETDALVDMIVSDAAGRRDLSVLDCGTGSGCIAISLARNLPFARVKAIDKSPEALAVARTNGNDLGVKVNFEQADMLSLPSSDKDLYDIIVSNPPYIAEHERASMESHVIEHEPGMALFVPDDDPLVFYREVAAYAHHALAPDGKLYFEINPLYAGQLATMLQPLFDDVDIIRDSQGLLRYATAIRHR
ncbi:MAG: peptide chain release factor N(5)-glutamine methyltransferase [Muribaculaceae bacterium]|nr:peptide chain release factor N(5)-glutamine methyltransferase [Muribaculaceae bacterium]